MRVAVVGAGIMGASTALALAERGHEVALFEQFSFFNEQGSSHGRSRIIRKAYPDAFYTAIMDEAYGLWHELQRFSPTQFVFEPGLLYFGRFESESLRDVIGGLQQLGVPHELFDHDQVRRVFPALRMEPGEIGVFTPEAGWVNAELAIETTLNRLADLGGVIMDNHRIDASKLRVSNEGPTSALMTEIRNDFDGYVLCPGPWITSFVDIPVRVTLQTYGYVEPVSHRKVDGPVWIEDSADLFYGFPSEPGARSFKIGVHKPGPLVNPASSGRNPTPVHMEAIQREARERFGIEAADFNFRGCLYTNTVDEDFLLGRHGEKGFFVSACSGHGFKFGPWIGRLLANFVEEKDAPENHPRFCWPKPRLEA